MDEYTLSLLIGSLLMIAGLIVAAVRGHLAVIVLIGIGGPGIFLFMSKAHQAKLPAVVGLIFFAVAIALSFLRRTALGRIREGSKEPHEPGHSEPGTTIDPGSDSGT